MRPTPDRVRETIFNWLMQDVPGALCLDLFAGSGILGIEALSRGAIQVDFVERNQSSAAQLERSLLKLDALDSAHIFCAEACAWLRAQQEKRYDIIFLDPPYQMAIEPLIKKIAENNISANHAIVYIEQNQPLSDACLPKGWSLYKHKQSGQVHYHLIQVRR